MTQKKMIFYDDSDFENIGIEPNVKWNPEEEHTWVEFLERSL